MSDREAAPSHPDLTTAILAAAEAEAPRPEAAKHAAEREPERPAPSATGTWPAPSYQPAWKRAHPPKRSLRRVIGRVR